MPTLNEIKSQIKGLGGVDNFLGRKEIKELPNILWDDETVENIIQGFYNNGNGILVATNKRLVFVDKGLIFGLKVEDFPYDKITTIQYETGLLFGKLTIFSSSNKAVIEQVTKSKVRVFGDWVRARVSESKENVLTHKTSNSEGTKAISNIGPLEKLERLAKLKEQGILSHEEFETQKRKILSSM